MFTPGYGLAVIVSAVAVLRSEARRSDIGATRRRRVVTAVVTGTGALALAAAIALPAAIPVFHFAKPSGPYRIGTLTYHWTDASRHEIFSSDAHAVRELMAQIWYPVDRSDSSTRASYAQDAGAMSSATARILSSAGSVRLPGFFFDHFKYVTTNAIPAAPIATDKPNYPVLLYVTGLGGFRQVSTFQVENLVSHGYIVVGLDQPYAAAAVTFPGGHHVDGVPKDRMQPLIDQSISLSAHAPTVNGVQLVDGIIPYLAQDVSFALDQLAEVNRVDPDHIVTGRLDMGAIGAFGVSLGAMAVGETCHRDQRLKACLMMDAGMPADVVGGRHPPDAEQYAGRVRQEFARLRLLRGNSRHVPRQFHRCPVLVAARVSGGFDRTDQRPARIRHSPCLLSRIFR